MVRVAKEGDNETERMSGSWDYRSGITGPTEKSPPVLVAGLLPAAHKCSRSASYQCAIGEIGRYDGNGCPACGRMRPPRLTRAEAAPTIDPCPGSIGSAHPAFVSVLHCS